MADEMSTDQLVNEIEKLVEADGSRGQPEQQQNNVEEGDVGEEDKTTNHREEEEREREEETEKLKQVQSEAEKKMNLSSMPAGAGAGTGGGGAVTLSFEDKVEVDSRSIYVGNVDYGTTSEELEAHFHGCGPIKRITIPCNKFDGHQKGFAYIEFGHKNSVDTAMTLDGSLFRGRPIKVLPKRTNIPGMSTTNRGARGGRGRSRGGFRGGPFFGFH